MKRIFAFVCTVFMISILAIPASAAQTDGIISSKSYTLDNGIEIIDELILHSYTRSSTKDYTLRRSFSKSSTTIAVIAIYGDFKYDGNTVSVVSKSVSQTDTYDGWSYSQSSFSSSGGSITLNAKLTKLLNASIPITMTLSCDADGNISYS